MKKNVHLSVGKFQACLFNDCLTLCCRSTNAASDPTEGGGNPFFRRRLYSCHRRRIGRAQTCPCPEGAAAAAFEGGLSGCRSGL